MVKKYVLVRMPIEAYKGFMGKKEKMESTVKNYTGKETRIPLTKVFIEVANNPTEIHEKRIIRLTKKRVRRVRKCVA